MTTRQRRRTLVSLTLFGVAAALLARPVTHFVGTARHDVNDLAPLPTGYVDDASRMNAAYVAEVWPIPHQQAESERQLAHLLKRARAERLPVAIAGARHTMGGHTIAPDGIVVDMSPLCAMKLDEQADILHVDAGAHWSAIIPYLDSRGRSVAIMQSNNSFSVGGSLSANCHGWQYGKPPIASTVESFRLMLADGTIVACSRDENVELFSLVLGGYGLFGVILDVQLRVVPNERYRLEQSIVPAGDAIDVFESRLPERDDVVMAYGRLTVVPGSLFSEAIINILRRDPAPDGALPALHNPRAVKLRRSLFRGSAESDYGKELRWAAEVKLQPRLNSTHFSRNQLLNEGVEVFQNRSAATTDVLHEYFVPHNGAAKFIRDAARVISADRANLLNVTVRYVDTDRDTFLRYADQPMLAFVMLFNQPTTAAADARMEAMTRELIDAALTAGGRYYLPYRLHATREQFERAYPMAGEFFKLKRKYDPHGVFQNQFYARYAPIR